MHSGATPAIERELFVDFEPVGEDDLQQAQSFIRVTGQTDFVGGADAVAASGQTHATLPIPVWDMSTKEARINRPRRIAI